jgi:hypothetical protein
VVVGNACGGRGVLWGGVVEGSQGGGGGGAEIFLTRTDGSSVPTSLLYKVYHVTPEVKADGGVSLTSHPIYSRAELFLYSVSGPWRVLRSIYESEPVLGLVPIVGTLTVSWPAGMILFDLERDPRF